MDPVSDRLSERNAAVPLDADPPTAGRPDQTLVAPRPGWLRQKAYRDRLRDQGLTELRIRAPRATHDTLRTLATRYLDGDPVIDTAAARVIRPGRAAWLRAALPWSRGQWRMLSVVSTLGVALGLGGGVALQSRIDLGDHRLAAAALPAVRAAAARAMAERDALATDLAAARAEAVRLATDQAAITQALQHLQSGVGGLRDQILSADGGANATQRERGRLPTPPGPKLVPRAGPGYIAGPPMPAPPALPPGTHVVYEFNIGDTLEDVARRHGTTIEAIQTANDALRPQPWRFGDRLVIPLGDAARVGHPAALGGVAPR